MRVLIDNVDLTSSSGPNSFGRQLVRELIARGHSATSNETTPDVQLTFISATRRNAPIVQRLDGIYFNLAQDWQTLNCPIAATYALASAVVYQSEFDRELVERYFGRHGTGAVIRNGTDVRHITSVSPLTHPLLDASGDLWCCASQWRPHKRLSENIRYFQEHAGSGDRLVVCGHVDELTWLTCQRDDRIVCVGDVSRDTLLGIYRRSRHFVHLAYLDHCPNVVVDAKAAGCRIVCSSSGGTHELTGPGDTVIAEASWDFEPVHLYSPPAMDFTATVDPRPGCSLDIVDCCDSYVKLMEGVIT